jgi:hypothetical protein
LPGALPPGAVPTVIEFIHRPGHTALGGEDSASAIASTGMTGRPDTGLGRNQPPGLQRVLQQQEPADGSTDQHSRLPRGDH